MRLGSTALATGRIERRLAAILAADVAGYSRRMGVDEEGTLARLKAPRRALADPKIKEPRGRNVKTTGDGLPAADAMARPGGARWPREGADAGQHVQRLDRRPQSRARCAGRLAGEPPSASRCAFLGSDSRRYWRQY